MIRNMNSEAAAFESLLRSRTAPADPALVRAIPEKPDWVQCLACGHRCRLPAGQAGICKVRFNEDGVLRVPFDYVESLAVDPVEKKPFFHVLPGSKALSFGMLGCDLHCPYCQNWFTSQTLRDGGSAPPPRDIGAVDIVRTAVTTDSRLVISTYNEPLITSEWAMAVFREAKEAGLVTGYVSNGNATPEVLDWIRPWTDLYKVDLKAFDDREYRRLGTTLKNVLETIETAKRRGFWVEVVTLLVPGFNDSDVEVRELTRWLARVDPLIPWHVTGFHTDYKMDSTPSTRVEALLHAAEIGAESGLRYVYTGNRPGDVGEWENTRCHGCGATVIRRRGFFVVENRVGPTGTCPDCGIAIPGVWKAIGRV
jgi:pyruvate formate lyase activating enzyme